MWVQAEIKNGLSRAIEQIRKYVLEPVSSYYRLCVQTETREIMTVLFIAIIKWTKLITQ